VPAHIVTIRNFLDPLRTGQRPTAEAPLFAFDPERSAIMPIAGDKAGDRTRWYKKNIPLADDLFDDHLTRLRGKSRQWQRR
jgi:hypothetical protein